MGGLVVLPGGREAESGEFEPAYLDVDGRERRDRLPAAVACGAERLTIGRPVTGSVPCANASCGDPLYSVVSAWYVPG